MSKSINAKGTGLESVARLNPELLNMFSASKAKLVASLTPTKGGVPWWVYLIGAILLVAVFSFLGRQIWLLETPSNVRANLRKVTDSFNLYGDQRSSRKGLRQYLKDLAVAGVNESNYALTNFFVCSANSAAVFTPLRNGIVSPEAIRLSIAAGARYLDIPIYPDVEHGGSPIVCEMDAGSNWRRITMNQIPFRAIMQAVKDYAVAGPGSAVELSQAPYREDPLFIMLRFGGAPKESTFNEVAATLRDTIESARLDFTYNGARGAERLFKAPITEFFSKIIIITNVFPPLGNPLNDYINLGPRSAAPLEMKPVELVGIPDESMAKTTALIQQNLTISRQIMEESDCNTNIWDYKTAHNIGVQFAAYNFWSQDDNLKKYRAPAVFGVNSFLIKPTALRYVIEYTPPPGQPNPALNAGDGTPAAPAGLNLPVT
jgi:hypothetical protein